MQCLKWKDKRDAYMLTTVHCMLMCRRRMLTAKVTIQSFCKLYVITRWCSTTVMLVKRMMRVCCVALHRSPNCSCCQQVFPTTSNIVGDPAYPLMKHLMVSYLWDGCMGLEENKFNNRLSAAWCAVERASVLLKRRFWRLTLNTQIWVATTSYHT